MEGNAAGQAAKRALDIVAAAAGLVVAAPVIGAVAFAMAFKDPGPLFYGHVRVGRDGRPFRCLKLRSMVVDGDTVLAAHLAADPAAAAEWAETQKLRDDPRVTPLGRLLRKTSLDELPQLLNVLRGEMSLVGPRPVTEKELARYGHQARAYLSVRPGVTGPWQISGRSTVGFQRRIALDTHYVKTWTFARDVRIILLTVPAVLASRGSY
ncbi:succinoglycan exopolysaccharide synthesis protein [Stappia sp. 22II-S9-Z10]|nr:succinoglycan exopolysaccharide synthesis protein [Stappia sp. 22II-S9-Z10]